MSSNLLMHSIAYCEWLMRFFTTNILWQFNMSAKLEFDIGNNHGKKW